MGGLTFALVPLLVLLLQISGVYSGSTCTSSYWPYTTRYCTYDCCYSGSDQPCCSYSYWYNSIYGTASSVLTVGTIVGIVFGALVGIAVIVAIIVAICSCCCKTTRVVNPTPVNYTGHTMTVFHTNTSGAGPSAGNVPGQPQPYYGYGQPPQGPPPYAQKGAAPHPPSYIPPQGQPPPAYNYSDPAFPPPSGVPSAPANSTTMNQPPPPTPNPFAAAVNSAGNN